MDELIEITQTETQREFFFKGKTTRIKPNAPQLWGNISLTHSLLEFQKETGERE